MFATISFALSLAIALVAESIHVALSTKDLNAVCKFLTIVMVYMMTNQHSQIKRNRNFNAITQLPHFWLLDRNKKRRICN